MNIKIKKLNDNAIIPTYGTEEAAGCDIYAATSATIEPHKTVMVGTGLSMELPKGYFGGIFARSGLSTKQGLRPANCVGVIDSDYRGEFIVAVHNDSNETRVVNIGDRIAQLVVIPYIQLSFNEVDELETTNRANGGFGSTGK